MRVLDRNVILRDGTDYRIRPVCILYEPDRLLPADGDRIDCSRENNGIPESKHRDVVRKFGLVELRHHVTCHDRDDADFRTALRGENIWIEIFHKYYQYYNTIKIRTPAQNHNLPICHQQTIFCTIYIIVNLYANNMAGHVGRKFAKI